MGGALRGGWGALGWPRLWQSPQGQGLCLELSSGAWALTTLLPSAGVGRPLTLGRSPAHPGVPPPSLPPNGAPVFPSQAVGMRTGYTFGGSEGRSQSEASVLGTWRDLCPPPTRASGDSGPRSALPCSLITATPAGPPGWRTLTARETGSSPHIAPQTPTCSFSRWEN